MPLLRNLQDSLVEAIERNFAHIVEATNSIDRVEPSGFSDDTFLPFVAAPILDGNPGDANEGGITRLVRKFDPAERDLRNRTLGKRGEELVFQNERLRLCNVDPKLADKVKWFQKSRGMVPDTTSFPLSRTVGRG